VLAHQTKAAFLGGQREALLIGAISLLVGVAFLLFRGAPAVQVEADWEELDVELEPVRA
jgi:hypothetical protein